LNKKSPPSLLILVDNLRIGGIERNALDQMYQLSDDSTISKIVVMNRYETVNNPNFLSAEAEFVQSKSIDVLYAPKGRLKQLAFFKLLISNHKFSLIIDNTLTVTPLVRISCLLARKRVPVHCVIQQFPSLSSRIQLFKRMLSCQFSSQLFFNSVNYGNEWDSYKKHLIYRLLFRKSYKIIRNGVYLSRINLAKRVEIKHNQATPRFVFLGRLKEWKGLENLRNVDRALDQKCRFLIIAPAPDESFVKKFVAEFGSRIEFIFGKSIIDFVPSESDLHIYPVDYGKQADFVESVSTNCLEMALLGVISIVTAGGTGNWPELKELGLVVEVNWENLDSVRSAVSMARSVNVTDDQMDRVRAQISIANNLSQHLLISSNKAKRVQKT
jgi:glycosyltransferase involved in cell wall biosynthesis